MTVKIYMLKNDELEVHMMGKYVGVVWQLHEVKKQIKGEDGVTYSAVVLERRTPTQKWEHSPYINFYDIRQDSDGEYYKDDDCPILGGLSEDSAFVLAQELTAACDYIKHKEWENA